MHQLTRENRVIKEESEKLRKEVTRVRHYLELSDERNDRLFDENVDLMMNQDLVPKLPQLKQELNQPE